jgi:glycosyltransferase involved in cell wall biosynthesis
MKTAFLHFATDDACRFHRCLQPARFVPQDLPGVRLDCSSLNAHLSDGYDAFCMHGLPMPESFEQVAKWHRHGKKFVWSLDDDFLSVPDWNPAKPPDRAMDSYYLARSLADHILVSTPALADTFGGRWANRVVLAPNLLDLTLHPPAGHPPGDGLLTVMWSGGPTHARDVDAVVPAVRRVLDEHPGKVQVVWFGQSPHPALAASHLHKGLVWQPGVPLSMYWQVLAGIRPHIVLAPLLPCDFNLSKSAIRVYEAWALSAAVLATPWGEYAGVRDGEDGLVCRTEDDWYDHLSLLVRDAESRAALAAAGRRRVEAYHSWQSPAARRPWADGWSKILGADREPIPTAARPSALAGSAA